MVVLPDLEASFAGRKRDRELSAGKDECGLQENVTLCNANSPVYFEGEILRRPFKGGSKWWTGWMKEGACL